MGTHPNIDIGKFPKQGLYLNKKVEVCFNYDPSKCLSGVIVRDDMEEPGVLIIKLEDNRYMLSTECMYRILGNVH